MNATFTQRTTETATQRSAGINWKAYHEKQAAGFRSVADHYRKAGESLVNVDPQLAEFCVSRVAANEGFAIEEELLAGK